MSVRDLTILGCSSQQPTRKRNHGAYLLRWNDEGLLFDPGEGTQRQFIFANVAPTVVTRIFVSHFHGDHCLGLGSMLMRLNLDKVTHPIHCYYPASGKKYFDRLRYGTAYHEMIHVVEHPVSRAGVVHDDGKFKIEATFLDHGIDNIAWRITEPDQIKFDQAKLLEANIRGPLVRDLIAKGELTVEGKTTRLDDVSWIRNGDAVAIVSDTRLCQSAVDISCGAKILLCESTYLDEHENLAKKHYHLTAKQAASIAKRAGVEKLILTHFSARYLHTAPFKQEAETVFKNVEIAHDLKVIPFPKNEKKK
ncbi:MAG: Ribonuclease BN [Chlamydiales bacterium]|nr:Ribonuclease BN [Chlamydiales bacterium]MCH9619918.1 Ribonuclease BN [Chlamydiales bacterium]MCH9622655.1 Ribonuclease BN [Chlamydiales bacterium]